jgi:GMP synthase (glutamine-hydrolysing)
MKRVLIVRTGSPPAPLRARLGDFSDWFAELLAPSAIAEVADAESGLLPDAGRFSGILVTGSLKSVTRPEPWMDALGRWLVEAAERRPVLGVCFGHQLLGRALGGRVERHAAGPEAGTVEVELTEAGARDPLFAGLPRRLAVQECHEDHVPEAPPGAVLLARNGHAPVQAFAHGARLRSLQFHPEFSVARIRAIVESDREWLDRRRAGLSSEILAGLHATPEAERIIANWVDAYLPA